MDTPASASPASSVHMALRPRAWARTVAVLRQRCPICLQGKVFRSLLGMHTHCPVCGTRYEREHGYFLNSMFIAYAAGFLVLVPSALLLGMRNVSVGIFSAVIILETALVWPLIFRYSRVLWLHIDQMLDPRLPAAEAAPAALAADAGSSGGVVGDDD